MRVNDKGRIVVTQKKTKFFRIKWSGRNFMASAATGNKLFTGSRLLFSDILSVPQSEGETENGHYPENLV